jgi:succinate dehydrogenase / fumarate reductase membrane anchor subunit
MAQTAATPRSLSGSAPKPQETSLAWMVKVFTGPLLIVILIIHLIVNHYTGTNAGLMTYADVVRYFQNPLVVAMEMILVTTVVTHSLLGLRSIILDLHPSAGTMRVINAVLWVVGVGAVVYGLWLALVIASQTV